MKRYAIVIGCVLPALAGMARAQTFNTTGTTSLQLNVAAEAALSIDTGTTNLTAAPGIFANPFTGSTSLTYKIRTTKVGGTGSISYELSSRGARDSTIVEKDVAMYDFIVKTSKELKLENGTEMLVHVTR